MRNESRNRLSVIILAAVLSFFLFQPVAQAHQVALTEGWNLISLPEEPQDPAIGAVTAAISGKFSAIWTYGNGAWKLYDPANPGFSDLSVMHAGLGYWIKMNQSGALSYTGAAAPSSVTLAAGWNLVGYGGAGAKILVEALASISGKYYAIWTCVNGVWKLYDPVNPAFSDLGQMEPGRGYWIHAKAAATWAFSDDYAISPVVPGETTPESKGPVTVTDTASEVTLSDGTAVWFPGMQSGSSLNITLERADNTVAADPDVFATSGSMRVVTVDSFDETSDPNQFIPTIIIPAHEAGTLNSETIKIARVSDVMVDDVLVKDYVLLLTAHRDGAGNYAARDIFMPETLMALSASALRASSGQAGGGASRSVRYSIYTFQNAIDWATSPQLVRMVPDKSKDIKRVLASSLGKEDLEREMKKPVQNVLVLVHGHNEAEKAGLTGKPDIGAPWLMSYKRDVWTTLYDNFMKDYAGLSGCTVFYEYIYPTWRPIFTSLGPELATMLSGELSKQVKHNMPFNVFIVAHSMGGLVSRSALQDFGAHLGTALQKLVTWGSPHHGSEMVTLNYVLQANPAYTVGGTNSPGLGIPLENMDIVRRSAAGIQMDTPGTRDLRWDNKKLMGLEHSFTLGPLQVTDDQKFDLQNGTWLFSENAKLLNQNDILNSFFVVNKLNHPKYHFLYGVTTKRYETAIYKPWTYYTKYSEIAIGATTITELVRDPGETCEGYSIGASDGASGITSMSAEGIAGNRSYLGDIDHEEYYGAPRGAGNFTKPDLAVTTATKTFDVMFLSQKEYSCPEIELTSPTNSQTFGLAAEVPVTGQLAWPGDNKAGNRITEIHVKSSSSNKDITLPTPTIEEDGSFTGEFTAGDLADADAQYLAASALSVILHFKDDTELTISLGKLMITSVYCDYAPANARVTITGEGFGATQGSSTVTLNGALLSSIARWYDNSITLLLPGDATSGDIVVTVNGVKSNAYPYVIDTDFSSKLALRPNKMLFIEGDPPLWCTAPPVTAPVLAYNTDVNDPNLSLSQIDPGRISGNYHKAVTYTGTVNCTRTWDITFEDLPLSAWCTCYVNCDPFLGWCDEEYCANPPSFWYWDSRTPRNKIVYQESYTCDDGTGWSFNTDDCYDGYRIKASIYFSSE